MDLSVVPYKHHQSTTKDESEDGDVVEPKSADRNGANKPFNNPSNNVKYRECMRNHAASIGGHANDGCGEFMPCSSATPDGNDVVSLSCAACGCHRNFHRREIHGSGGGDHTQLQQQQLYPVHSPPMALLYNAGPATPRWDPKMVVGGPRRHHPPPPPPPHRTVEARDSHDEDGSADREYDRRSSETPEREDQLPVHAHAAAAGSTASGGGGKRFRTKFTAEQKDRMLEFAERIGWRIQRQDDAAINQFCFEIGVKRNVLKVWMHNNKSTHRRRESAPPPPSSMPEVPSPPPPPQPVGV